MVKYTLKQKVLKFLIENKDSPHSILEISRELKSDYKNTSSALNSLSQKVFSKSKIGNSYSISFNSNLDFDTFLLEKLRTDEFLEKHPKLKLLKNSIEEVGYPFMIALVFGSYAKNQENKNSDVDICIISDSSENREKLSQKLNLFSLNLEIQEFTVKEFSLMLSKKQDNLSHEIIKNNILLFGIENYYNLITKWTRKD